MQVGVGRSTLQQTAKLIDEPLVKWWVADAPSASAAAGELNGHVASMLTFLFLASGATKYETPAVGLKYMGQCRGEAEAALVGLRAGRRGRRKGRPGSARPGGRRPWRRRPSRRGELAAGQSE